jgi:hypothetical protein
MADEGDRAMAKIIAALVLLLSATSVGLAQSQTGANFGTPFSGTAAARSGGHNYYHARYRNTGGQSANGGGGARGEVDASDSNSSLAAAARARR